MGRIGELKFIIICLTICILLLGGVVYPKEESFMDDKNSKIMEQDEDTEKLLLDIKTSVETGSNKESILPLLEKYIEKVEKIDFNLSQLTGDEVSVWKLEVLMIGNVMERQKIIHSMLGKVDISYLVKDGLLEALARYDTILDRYPDVVMNIQESTEQGEQRLHDAERKAEEIIKKAKKNAREKVKEEVSDLYEIIEQIDEFFEERDQRSQLREK